MDRDRFERNGISIAFNDFITTPFYEVIYELIPTFELFVKLLHLNRQKWNDLVTEKNKSSDSLIINALDTNDSYSEISPLVSLDDIKPMNNAEPNNGRRLSIAAGNYHYYYYTNNNNNNNNNSNNNNKKRLFHF